MSFHFTRCEKCGEMYFVGLNGKDLRGTKSQHSGSYQKTSYVRFGNDQLEKCVPILDDETECPNCGATVKIQKTIIKWHNAQEAETEDEE